MPDPRDMVTRVARHLGPLCSDVVFVGGATAGFLMTDPASFRPRPTKDVDVIVEVATLGEYVEILGSTLRGLGFHEDSTPQAPRCRWRIDDLIVDIMPTDGSVLGLRNRWFSHTYRQATEIELERDLVVRMASGPCFVAMKLEAFHDRGVGDHMGSHDLEDVITLFDGREELVSEIIRAEEDLRDYVRGQVQVLLAQREFLDALPGFLLPDPGSQARLTELTRRLQRVARP